MSVSQLNLNPILWAHGVWNLLHYYAFSYPDNPSEEKIARAKLFFENLSLPCEICEENYKKYYTENPLEDGILKSRYLLSVWVNDFHNNERRRQGKPIFTLEQSYKMYSQYESKPNNDPPKTSFAISSSQVRKPTPQAPPRVLPPELTSGVPGYTPRRCCGKHT